MKHLGWFLIGLTIILGCQKQSETPIDAPPEWAKEVIWYQIFVERFHNGDPTNDPTREDIDGTYPGFVPDSWQTTPWTQQWYKDDPYVFELEGKTDPKGNPAGAYFGQRAQLRRYGGDLQGVLDKLDYLEELGITAVYFNPLNDAPSLHKYDARHWRHIDRNFGPSPREDVEIMESEIPDDPSTWRWTGADKMFLQVVDELHKRGIRVILDYSWNHTGNRFWAFEDVKAKGAESRFKDWYFINEFDDPATPENEFDYVGWFGVKELPEIKETKYHAPDTLGAYEADIYSRAVKDHIFAVSKRWLDPNGDGDPDDGVDGFRLDVAAEVGLEFWREYRKVVRSVNPEAYILGEVWWKVWPDELIDPKPFLKGDVFDAVMNYRWYRDSRHFFNEAPNAVSVTDYVSKLKELRSNLRSESAYAMMNLTASHDTPRFSTSMYNRNKYKYLTSPSAESDYKVNKPDEATFSRMKLLLVQQFTYIGAPHIWAGDEMGMWGADDPDSRKPLIWPELQFETETLHPLGWERPADVVRFDEEVFSFYKKMIQLRKSNPVLASGDIEYLITDDERSILAYSRFDDSDEVIVIFNLSDKAHEVSVESRKDALYRELLNNLDLSASDQGFSLTLPSKSVAVLSTE